MSIGTNKQDLRPTEPLTGQPIGPLAQPGYYPGFSTLSQQNFWDAKTREIVLDRVNNVPEIRFFSSAQASLLEAICNHIVPQDDRDDQHKIPIVPQIDRRLYENTNDGYRYEDMPPDRQAFVLGLQAIEEIAKCCYGAGFLDVGAQEQEEILRTLHDGNPPAASEIWSRLPPHRFWMQLVSDCVDAYYSHPFAWDEIGFGGPSYPRGYMRLERGEPEPWEIEERRYQWQAPPSSLSDAYEPVAGHTEQLGSPGQGGTH